jgi:hypothetical protein
MFRRSARGLFASESLLAHVARGTLAFALLAWAIQHQGADPGLALLAGVGALIAFRGCPICWTVGLFETLAQKLQR